MNRTGADSPRWSNRILRWMLGAIFIFAAPNHYLQIVEDPPMPAAALAFHHSLTATGYLFQIVVANEFSAGLLLLLGIAVPFALVLLAPIVLNIFCFHLFLAPGGLPIAVVLVLIEGILAWQCRTAFAGLFETRSAYSTVGAGR